ncbi:MAG TPA: hypothetical protein VG271_17845 [Beijerinckiaceae bacterium]|nr:hypothetical protein [Beijerinckiaceae bacterium]
MRISFGYDFTIVVAVASLLGCSTAFAWKVTTSNHNNVQHARVQATPSLYVRDVVPPEIAAQTQPHVKAVRDYVEKNVRPWLADPILIGAIMSQNKKHAHITIAEIDRLDAGFIERTDKQLIDSTMNNPLAAYLKEKKAAADGSIFEIFVVDNKGLNVAQTDPTLDYMQGDEAKFQKTFLVGPEAVFIDEAAPDNGVNVAQADMTIKHPKTGKAIGAIIVGVVVDKLN